MLSNQHERLTSFTSAQERNDAHTSASAMLRYFMEQMDLDSIKLTFSDSKSLGDMDSEIYFDKLQRAFLFMQMSGNTILESAEAHCNRCYPGVMSFTFKGNNIPWHISFLFHVQDNKVINIRECFAIWNLFPELDGGLKINLDIPNLLIKAGDSPMEDPIF